VSVGVTVGLTVTVIPAEVTLVGDAQADEDVKTQVTTWPLVSALVINVELLVPALVDPILHWNDGLEPPFVIAAVNVSGEPAQIVVLLARIVMVGVRVPTVIVIALDVAVVGDAQAEFEVMTQVTTCPLVSELVAYVGLLVPTLDPFTFHW
jgi:hypothetical protein